MQYCDVCAHRVAVATEIRGNAWNKETRLKPRLTRSAEFDLGVVGRAHLIANVLMI